MCILVADFVALFKMTHQHLVFYFLLNFAYWQMRCSWRLEKKL